MRNEKFAIPVYVTVAYAVNWNNILLQFLALYTVDRQRSDPAVAVSTGAAVRLQQRVVYNVGRHVGWVQDDWPRRGCSTLGWTQEQAEHELRQDESRFALLLWQEHHDQSARQAIRVQVRLRRTGAVDAADWSLDGRRRRVRLQVRRRHSADARLPQLPSSPSPERSRVAHVDEGASDIAVSAASSATATASVLRVAAELLVAGGGGGERVRPGGQLLPDSAESDGDPTPSSPAAPALVHNAVRCVLVVFIVIVVYSHTRKRALVNCSLFFKPNYNLFVCVDITKYWSCVVWWQCTRTHHLTNICAL